MARRAFTLPDPVTLDDVTFVFERSRFCYNSTFGRTNHCHQAPEPEFRLHGRQHIGRDLDRPVTLTIKVCGCVVCAHDPLDRDAFIEANWTVRSMQFRRGSKERYEGARDYRSRIGACLKACEGVDASELRPGLLRELLDAGSPEVPA